MNTTVLLCRTELATTYLAAGKSSRQSKEREFTAQNLPKIMSLKASPKKKFFLSKVFNVSGKFKSRDSDRKVELERLANACETKSQDVAMMRDECEEDYDGWKSSSPTIGGSSELRRFQMTENYRRRRNALSIKDHFEFQRLRTKRVQQQIIDTYVYGWK